MFMVIGLCAGWLAEAIMEVIFWVCVSCLGVWLVIFGGYSVRGVLLMNRDEDDEELNEFVERMCGK